MGQPLDREQEKERRGDSSGAHARSCRALAVAVGLHGLDDLAVAGAAAEVAGEASPDRHPVAGESEADGLDRAEHDAGRTEAALHRATFNQFLLQRVEGRVVAERAHGLDVCALRLDGKHAAGVDRDRVEEDGTSAADAFAAAVLHLARAGLVAQETEQRHMRLDRLAEPPSVHEELEHHAPASSFARARARRAQTPARRRRKAAETNASSSGSTAASTAAGSSSVGPSKRRGRSPTPPRTTRACPSGATTAAAHASAKSSARCASSWKPTPFLSGGRSSSTATSTSSGPSAVSR